MRWFLGVWLALPMIGPAAVDVDVALAYSSDAASRQGGEDNLQVNLANALAGANVAYGAHGGTGVRLRIAGFYQSTANPVNVDTGTVLSSLNSSADYQDVRDFGASVGADLVSYYSHSTGAAGVAYQPGMYSAMAEQWLWHIVVAHELGHNFGCDHRDGHLNPKTVMLHNYCGGGALSWFSNAKTWLNGVQLVGGDSCLGAAVAGGDNAAVIAGAAQARADARARVVAAPRLDNVVLHWAFTNAPGAAPAGTTHYDLVAGAPAIVRGHGATYTGGALRIPGGTTGNVAMNSMAAYIDLPNGILSSQTNLTIEIWATPLSAPNHARLLDFGRTTEAGDGLGAPGEYTGAPGTPAPGGTSSSDSLMLSTAIGTDLTAQKFQAKLNGTSTTLDSDLETAAGVPHHYAITFTAGVGAFGATGGRWQWYRDADAVAFLDVSYQPSALEDVNNWLGRSLWSGDSLANNEYAEVRISRVALSHDEVRANYLLGPHYGPVATVTLTGSDPFGTTSFNAAGQWSNGTAPSAANSYETFGCQLRTPATSASHTFAGHTLMISGGALVYKGTASSTITVPHLVLNHGAILHGQGGGVTCTLAGGLSATTNGGTINGAYSRPMTISANLAGTGPLTFLSGPATLTGNNSAFTGRMRIGNGVAGTVIIDSPSRLGAVPATFTSDQLAFNRGTLVTTATMTLSNDHRGILLDVSGGTFNVAAGTTLTLASPLSSPVTAGNAVVGGLSKAGAGTLILRTTNSTFRGGVWLDSGSASANDGVVRLVNNQALAQARSPFFLRNNNSASSTLQLDGSAGNLVIPQDLNVSCRHSPVPTIQNMAGTNTLGGFIALETGGSLFNIQSDAGLLIFNGSHQYVGSLTGGRTYAFSGAGDHQVNGPILNAPNGAPISVTKSGTGTLTLAGNNTYGSSTTVNGGRLWVNGTTAASSAVTVAHTATLGGNGLISGPITVNAGGTLAPGTSIGTLTLGTVPTLGGTVLMELHRTHAQTSDRLVLSSGTLNYGGTLTVTNLGPALQAGDRFTLFSATGYSGAFTVTNLPALDAGLRWEFAAGVASVVPVLATGPTNLAYSVSGNVLTLSWPSDHTGWRLQTQTNPLTVGLSTNWFDVPGSTGTNQVTQPITPNTPSVFFRLIAP